MTTSPLLSRPPEEGARILALHFLDQAAEAWPRLADKSDTEALHDFRVALRRLRSCLRAYRHPLEGSLPKKLLKKLRRLAQATNPGRDTEVQIEWLRGRGRHLSSYHRAGLTWLLGRMEARMQAAYDEMESELKQEFLDAESELRRRLSVYRTEVRLDGSGSQTTLAEVTAEILREHVRELEEHLARVETVEDEEEAHEARIAAKRARYLLEPLAHEIPGAGPLVKRFKAFQDLLGDLHDAHVLETELAQAVEEAAAERARRLFEISLEGVEDERLLRAAGRRAAESGVITLARLNRGRRDRLFQQLQDEWLNGKAGEFLREVEGLAEVLEERTQGTKGT
ncbi:MAG TPA: CHAD domain-containing protein [Thermoanaerobaculia bacterium]|nr:CHAD domain-containing protein [Thermoanaerobaculia bacterium]